MRQRRTISISSGLSCIALVLIWSIFAPTRVGGGTDYVIVNGNSMEPHLQQGDLVLVRSAANYQVGDVVTYRHPEIGPVIHRIVAQQGEHFIFQGDNNSWRDAYQPTSPEVIGKEWLRIAGFGGWLAHLRSPSIMALGAGLIGVMFMLSLTRPGGARQPGPAGRQLLDRSVLKEWLSVGVLVVVAAALALGLTFSKPVQRAAQARAEYTQAGRFGYTTASAAGDGIYDQGAAISGEPIFRQVSDAVALSFTYRVLPAGSAPAVFSGTWSLDAEISDVNGWKRTLPLQPETAFSGSSLDATALLTFAEVQAVIDRVERQTGVDRAQYNLAIVPHVRIDGTLAERPLSSSFAPRLEFVIDDLQLQVATPREALATALAPEQPGAVVWPSSEPNTMQVLAWQMDVSTARTLALAAFGLALLGLALGWLALTMFNPAGSTAAADDAIEVHTWSDLLELSQRLAVPVEAREAGGEKHYVVAGGGLTYAFVERAQQAHPA